MKKLILAIFTFISVLMPVFAQTNAGITTIGTFAACSGTIILPLNISGSPDLAQISLEIDYDGNVLSFVKNGGITDTDPNLASVGVIQANQSNLSGTFKKLRIFWIAGDANAWTVGNSGTGKICDLSFRYFGGTTALTFNNSYLNGSQSEYSTINGNGDIVVLVDNPSSTFYGNGGIVDNFAPTSASGTSPICNGLSSTLSKTGGSLGYEANWYWYTASCGGTYIISGATPVVNPTSTTTYYVRVEGTCNTTTCVSTIITVDSLSSSVTSVTANPSSSICTGSALTLTETGGTLGTGANWKWFTSSCNGNFAGNGTSIIIAPTVTTDYYIRAEGTCNTTGCFTVTVFVHTASAEPASVTVSPSSTVCSGTSVTMTENDAVLGIGATWQWYTISCGGTPVGDGVSLSITPTVTANYYVRGEGLCNTTGCLTILVTVNPTSTAPTSVSANPSSTVCPGTAITLIESGGTLGTGATWKWYTESCGGTFAGNGTELSVTPTITTNYYILAEGTCNTTGCYTASVTVSSISSEPTGVSANPSLTVCTGTAMTLSEIGGSLGTGASWQWYTGLCGGTSAGNGVAINITPTAEIIYYVRAEGTCGNTSCITVNVELYLNSEAAAFAESTPGAVCSGNTSILTLTGGSLGTGAGWKWYSGSCTSGTSEGTGSSITVTPVATTVYYVRAEGTCSNTSCVTANVELYTSSASATSAESLPAAVCPGNTSVLTLTGGSLGTGASWQWYTGSCTSGTSISSGTSVTITPVASTLYFVRAEGTCGNTSCVTANVELYTTSVAATSAESIPSEVCSGNTSVLTLTGGSLGTGSVWKWYSGSCSAETSEGTGTSITVTPITTAVYYVRAEGTCGNTICVTANVSLSTISIAATSASSSPSAICSGNGSTLSVSGGTIGTNALWKWYTTSCGVLLAGNGIAITVSPTETTTYYVRAEGDCNTTECVTVEVFVNTISADPSSALAASSEICNGSSTTINVNGTLGVGATWLWYTVSCGNGTAIGSGGSILVSPTVSTTYWVRAENLCNSTNCVSSTISVFEFPSQSSPISGDTIPQFGNSFVYSVINDINITNYTWTSPSGWSGTSITNSITYLIGANSGLITLTPSNVCGIGAIRTLYVNVGFTVSGYFTYANIYSTPLDSVEVFLKQNGNILDSTQADINGYYTFDRVINGTYNITATTHKPAGSINGSDALIVQRVYLGSTSLTSSITLHAADGNNTSSINGTDVVYIQRYILYNQPFPRGIWIFEKMDYVPDNIVPLHYNDTVIVNGNNALQDMKGLCVGDVNGSWIPPQGKSESKIAFSYNSVKNLKSDEYFEIPLKVTENIDLGAISMIVNYPKELIEVVDVRLTDIKYSQIKYNVLSNNVRIVWTQQNDYSLNLKQGDTLLIIKVKTKNNFKPGNIIRLELENSTICELTNPVGIPYEYSVIDVPSIEYNTSNIERINDNSFNISIYPNPATNFVKIRYRIEENEYVNISLFNYLGEVVANIEDKFKTKGEYITESDMSNLQSGIYYLRIVLNNNSVIIRKVVFSK
jgi:hypothetical protein